MDPLIFSIFTVDARISLSCCLVAGRIAGSGRGSRDTRLDMVFMVFRIEDAKPRERPDSQEKTSRKEEVRSKDPLRGEPSLASRSRSRNLDTLACLYSSAMDE